MLANLLLLPAEERPAEKAAPPPSGSGALVLPIGDLLWALRMRRGWTQEHMAAEFGLRCLTISRWESGDNAPSGETVARLSLRLCDSVEERKALWNSYLSGLAGEPLSLEAVRMQVERIECESSLASAPLFELSLLPLQRYLHHQTRESDEAVRLLARVEVRHSYWLYYQERPSESRIEVQHALSRVRYRFPPEPYWLAALNIASANVRRASGGTASLQFLLRWLPRFQDPAMRAHLLADSAVTALLARDTEQATALLRAAHQVTLGEQSASTLQYVRLSTARIQLATRGDGGAWETVIEETPQKPVRLFRLLLGASSALLAGANSVAEDYLRRAEPLFTPETPPILSRQFAELTRELDGSSKSREEGS